MPTAVLPLSNQARIEVGQLAPSISPTAETLGAQTFASLGRFVELSQVVAYFYRLTGMPVALDPLREVMRPTLRRLAKLATWEDGWNGYDALAPDKGAVAYAQQWILKMWLAAADVRRPWNEPNVTGGPEGEVVFEWWYGSRKLTVYVTAEHAEYLEVWGADINSEMAEGQADLFQECRAIWLWLTGGE